MPPPRKPPPESRSGALHLRAAARAELRNWSHARKRVLERGARRGDVHQWRIATRRLLALERLLSPTLPPRDGPQRLEVELQRAFRASGRLRDDHIGIALARDLAPAHPVARRVAAALRRRLPRRRRKLMRRLEQVRVERLRRIVRSLGGMDAGGKPDGDALARRAAARLAQAQRRTTRGLSNATPSAEPGDLHRLRIDVKQARYMASIFATLPAARRNVAASLRSLAAWQRELGTIADLAAFDAEVERFARDEPASADDVACLRRALARRQRRLVRSFVHRHQRAS